MYGLANEHEILVQQRRRYVVRDLSWELARYLDTEAFSASASATSNSVSGHHGRTPEERVGT